MRYLTIDGGQQTGWTHGDPTTNTPPMSGVFRLPTVQVTDKLIALESFLIDMIKANGITDVFIEKSIIPKVTSYDAIVTLAGYNLIAGMAARRTGCNSFLVDMQSWRSELGLPTQGPKTVLQHPDYARFVGKKDGLKQAKRQWVKDATKRYVSKLWGVPIESEDAADAAALYACVKARYETRIERPKMDLFGGLII